ncbi:hypothetical protein B0O80DRAFT_501809 [Mortierella sp. GBAus27b]|nr:hypothetical protein B0O80DRAFT_501809 [Mortierella sp. GBAus27b]
MNRTSPRVSAISHLQMMDKNILFGVRGKIVERSVFGAAGPSKRIKNRNGGWSNGTIHMDNGNDVLDVMVFMPCLKTEWTKSHSGEDRLDGLAAYPEIPDESIRGLEACVEYKKRGGNVRGPKSKLPKLSGKILEDMPMLSTTLGTWEMLDPVKVEAKGKPKVLWDPVRLARFGKATIVRGFQCALLVQVIGTEVNGK